jgi:phosphoglycolate phosphatase-like HAD superfamily hydrolase
MSPFKPALAAALFAALAAPAAFADDDAPPPSGAPAALATLASPEYDTAALGLYALARMRLDEAIADSNWTALPDSQGPGYRDQPTAIITQLGTTVLGNGLYLPPAPGGTAPPQAQPVPGAADFLDYAVSKGVTVFYISNRTADDEPVIRQNLLALGLPSGGDADTILSDSEKPAWAAGKASRALAVAANYRVLLVLGDSLGDFIDGAGAAADHRLAVTQASQAHWGHDWIMLPVPESDAWLACAVDPGQRRQAAASGQKATALDAAPKEPRIWRSSQAGPIRKKKAGR